MASIYRRILATLILLGALSGCGGGGGGGGGGESNAPAINLSADAVGFVATSSSGTTPSPQTVTANVTGVTSGVLYVRATISGNAVASVSIVLTGDTSAQAIINPVPASSLGVGTFSSTISIVACLNDPTCATGQLAGSPRTINVTYRITGISTSVSAINLTAIQGGTSNAAALNVAHSSGSVSWTSSINYTGGTTGWLTVSPATGSSLPATLTVQGSALPVGTYSATVTVTANGDSRSIPVTYTVTSAPLNAISAAPASLTLAHVLGSSAASANVNLLDSAGASYPWNASALYSTGTGWLRFNVSSGTSLPATLSVSGETNIVAGTYTGTIRATGNGTSVDVPVTYSVRAPTLSAGQASISWSAGNGQLTPPQTVVSLTTENGSTVPYTTNVTYGASANGWLTVTGSSAPGSLTIAANTANLAVGTHTATVRLNPSNSAPSVNINVFYTIRATTISSNVGSMSLNAYSGQVSMPSAINVTVATEPNSSVPFTTSVIYGAGASGWLTAPSGTAPGPSLPIGPNTTNLAPGTYTATVRLTPSTGAPAVNIPVTYTLTVSSLTTSPASQTFNIDAASTATPTFLTRTVNVGTNGAPLTWTAVSSVPWLTITASGSSGDVATLNVVPTELMPLENGALPALVTFTYNGPFVTNATRTYAVTLNLQLARINFVSPYVATPGSTGQVIVRGSGFNALSGRALMVGSNAIPASSYSLISDTEIRFNTPPLSAGGYAVKANNDLGVDRPGATLVVATPPSYAATMLSYPSVATREPRALIYDAERQALLVGIRYPSASLGSELLRYSYSNGSWTGPTSVVVGNLRGAALSPDGQRVLAISDISTSEVDPVSLTIGTVRAAPFSSFYYLNHLIFANDGTAIITTGLNGSGYTDAYRYSIRTSTLSSLPCCDDSLYFGTPGVSGNGALGVFVQGGLSPPPSVYSYNASTAVFGPVGLSLNQNNVAPALDRTGSRIILRGVDVYSQSFTPLGNLPGTPWAIVLKPDGTRAYTYDPGSHLLRTFDLTQSPVGGFFPEVGVGTALPGGALTATVIMTISPDGGTLFLAGSNQIVVLPTP